MTASYKTQQINSFAVSLASYRFVRSKWLQHGLILGEIMMHFEMLVECHILTQRCQIDIGYRILCG